MMPFGGLRALWRRFQRTERGAAIVEFAFIAPLLLLMAGGVYELGRGFQSMSAANKLASQYAFVWADCVDLPAGACRTEMGLYTTDSAVRNLAPQLTNSVNLSMHQVLMTGSTPTVTYAYPANRALTASQRASATAMLTNGQSGVVVTVTYQHTPHALSGLLSGLIPNGGIPMTYTVVQLRS